MYQIEQQPWPRTRMLSFVDIDLRNVHIKVNAVCRWWRQEAWIIDQGYQTIAYAVGYRNNQTFCLRNQIKEQLLSPELLWNIFFLIFKISTLKLYKKKQIHTRFWNFYQNFSRVSPLPRSLKLLRNNLYTSINHYPITTQSSWVSILINAHRYNHNFSNIHIIRMSIN
jgi:hypothetical protein